VERRLAWHEYLTVNLHWLGLSTATGIITPVLLPYLVAFMVPPDQKNSSLATVRVISLAVAMAVQPIAGLLSDGCTSRWGRRRPFVLWGTLASILLLGVIGLSSRLPGAPAYWFLVVGTVLWQAAANVGQGAMQGLIPDLVPENRRGRASGAKAVLELVAVVPIVLISPLVDRGAVWAVLGLVALALLVPMLGTVLTTREQPLAPALSEALARRIPRLMALALLFVGVTRLAAWAVGGLGGVVVLSGWQPLPTAVVTGAAGLAGMAVAVLLGVWLGAWAGLGREGRTRPGFVWWVVNRLLFLAAVGSIQGFTLYFLRDVHGVQNAATMTARLAAVVGLFLIPSALAGGYLADRVGRRRLVAAASLVASAGAWLLVAAPGLPQVFAGAAVLGTATGAFMAANWALGTALVPPVAAGRFLGVANLAGAGAGIVGVGIGGSLADQLNILRPGLGYLALFAVYAVLFLLSALALVGVRERHQAS
jgi:MFS family permease